MDCWQEDPSKRPTFSALIEKFEVFSNDMKPLIQFPRNTDKRYPHVRDIIAMKHHLMPENPYLFEQRYSYHHGNEYPLAGGLKDESDVRRVSSVPILEKAECSLFAMGVNGNIKKQPLSKSYSLPQREIPKQDVHVMRHQSKDLVLPLDIPRVYISAAVEK